jgi:hypothetical protein
MSTRTRDLLLLEDLEDGGKAGELAHSELAALTAVADWIKTYVVQPHPEIGRPGTVCPYVPRSLERRSLWLASEQVAGRDSTEVVELMSGYKQLLLDRRTTEDEDVVYDVIAVVFTDLPAAHAKGIFDAVQQELGVTSYVEDGILFGPYYEGNAAPAIYNPGFRPFESPAPFMFVRHGVLADWKFFLDDDNWLGLWARRYGEPAVHALADELRRLPWRSAPHST